MSNSPVCVDASFVVRLLQAQSDAEPAVRLYRSWMEDGRRLVAPTLLPYEVANALYRYAAHGYLRPEGVEALMEQAFRLGIALYGDPALHLRAIRMARESGLPAVYDAHYLALAHRLNAEFWTADRRLFQAVQGRIPKIHLLEMG